VAVCFAIACGIVSIACVTIGCFYIEDVWMEDYNQRAYVYGPINYPAMIASLWGIFSLVVHVVAVYLTKKHSAEGVLDFRYTSSIFLQPAPGADMVKEIVGSPKRWTTRSDNDDDVVDNSKLPDEGNHDEISGDDVKETALADTATNNVFDLGQDRRQQDIPDREDSTASILVPQLHQGCAKDFLANDTAAPSVWFLFRVKMVETYGCLCCFPCCCCKDVRKNNNLNHHKSLRMSAVTEMKSSPWWRFFDGVNLFLWYCMSMFFLYLTIVNIGAVRFHFFCGVFSVGTHHFLPCCLVLTSVSLAVVDITANQCSEKFEQSVQVCSPSVSNLDLNIFCNDFLRIENALPLKSYLYPDDYQTGYMWYVNGGRKYKIFTCMDLCS
jgi:hypothetical protein